jgi:hypothetical protein
MAVQQEKGLRHFGWFFFGVETVPPHLPLAVAEDAVGVQGQERTDEVLAGAAQFAQTDLELRGLLHGVSGQQVVHGQVGRDKRQTIGQLKTFLGEGAPLPVGAQAHGRFVDQVQGQARFDARARQPSPRAQQVPGAQAQVLRQQQPNTDLIARDFIRQRLANLPFQALGIGGQ